MNSTQDDRKVPGRRRCSAGSGRWPVALLVGILAAGCGGGPFLPECDDPFPALVVQAVDSDGTRIDPDKVEAFQGGTLVDTLECGPGECATWNLATGTYRIVATLGAESREQTVAVENSHACDHDVAQVEFVF